MTPQTNPVILLPLTKEAERADQISRSRLRVVLDVIVLVHLLSSMNFLVCGA